MEKRYLFTHSHLPPIFGNDWERWAGIMTNNEAKSGGLVAAENIGAQIATSHLVVGDSLYSGPVLRVEKDLVGEPVRDRLLAQRRTIHVLGKEIGEGTLGAAADSDRATKCGNVRFIHDHRLYKWVCNDVNKPVRMTTNKVACIVTPMTAAKRKPIRPMKPLSRERKRPFVVGIDGRTANERFREAFRDWEPRTQVDLSRACNRIAGRPEDAEPPFVSQQIIDQIIRDQMDAARSSFLDVLAEALGVRAVWLRLGAGAKGNENSLKSKLADLIRSAG